MVVVKRFRRRGKRTKEVTVKNVVKVWEPDGVASSDSATYVILLPRLINTLGYCWNKEIVSYFQARHKKIPQGRKKEEEKVINGHTTPVLKISREDTQKRSCGRQGIN